MYHDPAEVVIKKLVSKREPYRSSREWNQAHRAGATCPRELAYWRLYPEKALPEDPSLMLIFKHGNWMEREAIAQLDEAGYEVSEQGAAFEWREMQLRGRMDCKVRIDGAKRPVEIKGYSDFTWSRLNTVEDFLQSDKEYLRRVPGQLLSYILLDGKSDWGLLYLLNKVTGQPKAIRLSLEGETLEWGEALLRKLQAVNAAVEKNELPPRIEYSANVCGVCAFRGDCLQNIPGGPDLAVLAPDQAKELLELLEERSALLAANKRFLALEEKIGKLVEGHERLVVGDWLITRKLVEQERIDTSKIPTEERKKYTKIVTYWRKSITNLREPRKPDED